MEKKNVVRIVISIVLSAILLIGGTYAAWNFLTEETNITMTVDGDQITFDAGSDITITNILPVYSMEEGITKDIVVYKENGDYTAGINLYLNLKTWPSALSSASFRWALYKNGSYLSSGSFAGKSQGNNVQLTSTTQPINLEANKDTYKLYLWIDAYQESSSSMMNQTFTVSLYGQATFYNNDNPVAAESTPNAPELADGMIPIKYDYTIDEWVKADSTNADNDWYDYYNKIWANAVMVTSDTRDTYTSATAGTTINQNDILAYYVWIPRYRYILFNTNFAGVSAREIQIEFQDVNDEISNGTQNDEYLTHPAFWWDVDSDGVRESGEEISGFWAGKFETSGNSSEPRIKPNVTTATSLNVYNLFNMNKKFESTTYLTETGVNASDAHMMKNMEWGAVAYLSHSKYGINTEVKINNNSEYITGRQGNYTYNDFVVVDGEITTAKEAGTGVLASTTGNVYGVYDMSGGAWEYVMGMMKTSTGTLYYQSSGFNDNNMVESKYYDLYEYGESASDYTRSKLGDATGETRNWYGDYQNFITSSKGWFLRGGYYGTGSRAGVFNFIHSDGDADSLVGARAVLLLP